MDTDRRGFLGALVAAAVVGPKLVEAAPEIVTDELLVRDLLVDVTQPACLARTTWPLLLDDPRGLTLDAARLDMLTWYSRDLLAPVASNGKGVKVR